MNKNRTTEQKLLDGLDPYLAHADALAEPLPQELSPLERLKGSVKQYVRPTDPVWDEYFESEEGISGEFTEVQDQPSPNDRN
ncbi:hypothetical protein [Saccharospirillum sp.]|uniref:hypothetical protein n=1 Tax=Saccharospirillum sp. TaxID=2033801 RepID=UPI0034A02EFD